MTSREQFAVAHEECFNAIQLGMPPHDIAKRAEALAHWAHVLDVESRTAPDGVVGNDPLIAAMNKFLPIRSADKR